MSSEKDEMQRILNELLLLYLEDYAYLIHSLYLFVFQSLVANLGKNVLGLDQIGYNLYSIF